MNRVWRPGPGNSRSRKLFSFFDGIGTSIGNIWYQKKVSESVSEKNLVPKKVSESVSRKNWYQKKVLESVSKKFGTERSLGIGLGKITGTDFRRQNLEILKISMGTSTI